MLEKPNRTRLAVALTILAFACGSEGGAPGDGLAAPWTAPAQTNGSERCADCHRRIVDSYARTGMARALGPVDAQEFEGLGEVADEPAGYSYGFRVDAGRARIIETHAARSAHRQSAELAFAIGAGELDRSYAAVRGPFLWFAPLEVVTVEGGRRAALAPGHAIRSGARFDTPITPECLGCHTDAPPPRDYPLHVRPPGNWQPRGISCAACHGDTSAHADWREAEASGVAPSAPDPVLRAGDLTRIERLSTCAACHLQGDARIVLDPTQLGPPPPGADLLEQRAVFVAAEPNQDVGFVSHVERLVLSRCFLESETMTCETCHDPHFSLHDAPERRRVRDACTACHAADTTHADAAAECARSASAVEGQDCADCHMRTTGVFDVADVEIHDHFIRVDPGAPSRRAPLRFAEAPDGDWKRFQWPGASAPDHVDDPGLWMMAASFGGHEERALALVDSEPGSVVRALPMYHHVRASLLERAERGEDAVRAYRRALQLDPDLGASAVNLGLLLGQLGRGEEGLQVLDRVLERYPRAQGALRNRALVRYGLGDVRGFARDLAVAYAMLPGPELATTLAQIEDSLGNPAGAAARRAEARELDPLLEVPE